MSINWSILFQGCSCLGIWLLVLAAFWITDELRNLGEWKHFDEIKPKPPKRPGTP